jgi:serine protease Do
MGIGFSIPINMARKIYEQLVAHGSISRGYLGVVIQDLTQDLAASFGLADTDGILVAEVSEDSPAKKAGLRVGDVILELDGKKVRNVGAFRNEIALAGPGRTVALNVIRGGEHLNMRVTLGSLGDAHIAGSGVRQSTERLGFEVKDLNPDIARQFGLEGDSGVVVAKVVPGSPAHMAGLAPGVLISEVNRSRVRNIREYDEAIDKAMDSGTVLLLVKQQGHSRFIILRVER